MLSSTVRFSEETCLFLLKNKDYKVITISLNDVIFLLKIRAICDLKGRFDVDVTVDTSRCVIALYGTKNEISKASDHYHMIILEAVRSQQDEYWEKCISDYIQWYFVDGSNECIEYPSNINRIIEEAYRSQEKDVKFTNECGAEYIINFQDMNTFPSFHQTGATAVTRKRKGSSFSYSYNHRFYVNLCLES